ncbi:secretion protein HlyD [Exilibacterium tricleocarpae]|uniref:Secretion protein HlyD n=1 Tax=Exilibacterium tricleocarpae TaxID=2591008 RepID=A0A545TSC9_9GAMM|nr:PQQ-dependent sugar dehydrogenase [Exilibacterium tricleocarpae]TQV80119.1 secretion protein HlyD [Exilibacterium tricleocarpae]
MKNLSITTLLCLLVLSAPALAQNRIVSGAVKDIYDANCASCHGADLNGGQGGSLIDGQWRYGSSNAAITKVIRDGIEDGGMPGFGATLSEEQIRALVILMREAKQAAASTTLARRLQPDKGVFKTQHHNFSLERMGEGTGILWALDFFPDGAMIATQRDGVLWHFKDGKRTPIKNTPKVWQHGQGGLLDVKLHPDYPDNQWVYLAYSESGAAGRGMTAVVRGRIKGDRWVDQEDIFRAPPEFHNRSRVHFGVRLVFKDGYLFFGIGDRGAQDMAQDLTRPYGKIHRLHDDGRIPKDNPFVGKTFDGKPAYASIWTYGNRNPQGLDSHPVTGALWETEHGPRGGDELNLIRKGKNYGWPVITYGMNYSGTPITDKVEKPGMEQPVHFWVPSIAVCGTEFYEGGNFPKWKNHLFAGSLSAQQLHRLEISEQGEVIAEEIVLKDQGRIRDVASGPDGNLYILLNQRSPQRGAIYRLVNRD